MNERITQALSKLFDRHRIVFWYDSKQELRKDFEDLSLPGIEKLELANNEYSLKYRMLREEPSQKFLLYHDGPQPADMDNWLLDVQLAHGEFRTDQVAIWLSELELSMEFAEVVQDHTEFFQASKRIEALKKLLDKHDTHGMIRLKMLAVCAGSDPRMDSVTENLLQELADGNDDKIKLIKRSSLDTFLWEQMKRYFGYRSEEPGIHDFVIELFKSCYAMGTDESVKMTSDALVFLKRWKDSLQYKDCYEKLSDECAEVLNIEQDLLQRDFRELIELDYFRLIDKKIISELVNAVVARTVPTGDVALWIRQRRQCHWYENYSSLYEAVDLAAQFLHSMDKVQLNMESMADGMQRYTQNWFLLDQLYRKFTYQVRMSGQSSLMSKLTESIENLYSNNYLLKTNDLWHSFVDKTEKWNVPSVYLQKNFFSHWVQPFLKKDNKVFVIISDALRYEIGDELLRLIRQEDRYTADLNHMLSMLPSYTQLGMAALLPNRELALAEDGSGNVQVDGISSQGTANRTKILQKALSPKNARAITADDFMEMPREGENGYRELFKENDVVYIYHNHIDSTGDKLGTEERVFEAVEKALQEILTLLRKLANANATNMLVTADHGFIYQNRAIEESDFSGGVAEGKEILFRDRRFVLGRGLKDSASLTRFQSNQLGLSGDLEVQIPKSINRLRLKGSGSRFVHGGASLQEVVIPVIRINKKRQSDISAVEVEIIRGSSSTISSSQLAVMLYQSEPVTDKVQPRILRAGIYTESGDLISDSHELIFDLASKNSRDRELRVKFVLTSKADEANNQEVILKLEEKHSDTNHYKEYKSIRYLIQRSFTSDFDF